jgi:hypothetical protein
MATLAGTTEQQQNAHMIGFMEITALHIYKRSYLRRPSGM